MRIASLRFAALFTGALLTLPLAAKQHHAATGKSHKKATVASTRPRAMDDARATEIQTALVKAGYLPSASGHWDEASADAMRKLQSDNGWQTKLIPDSRALIKLGLGPGGETSGSSSSSATANLTNDAATLNPRQN